MTYLTVSELARKLGVDRAKIYHWIGRKHNPLPAYRSGDKDTRIIEEEFLEWYRHFRVNPDHVEKLVKIV